MKKIFTYAAILVLLALVTSGIASSAAGPLENATANIKIELTPDARREVTVHAEIPITGIIENIGFLNSASIQVDISSPDHRLLQIAGNASVTFTEPVDQNLDVQLAEIALTYSSMPNVVNSYLQQLLASYIENFGDQFFGSTDLQLENACVTSFSWQSPTLSAGVSMTFSSTVFENQQLRDELPISIRGNINITSTSARLRVEGNSTNYNGWVEIVATADTLTIDGFISSPLEVTGENVRTDIGLNLSKNMGNLLEGTNTTVTLVVPEDANVQDLLPGFTQEGNNYTWQSENGASLIADIAAGRPLASVSYKYVPPSSTWLIMAVLIVIVTSIASAGIILWRRR
jgi:hypothetical protein